MSGSSSIFRTKIRASMLKPEGLKGYLKRHTPIDLTPAEGMAGIRDLPKPKKPKYEDMP